MVNESLIEIVERYFEKIPRPYANYEYGRFISQRKLNNAQKLYAPYDNEKERPLLLIDDTIFKSAKEGILLTNENIYFRLSIRRGILKTTINCIPLKEITDISFELGKKGSDLIVNGKKVAFTTAFGIGGLEEKEGKIINRLFEIMIDSL
ncbi:MAG TPA: hypothetical protein PKN87_04805 [Syntrophomonadaceae bacterium]|nr:hypothetical protein [Syntrophomonadaceae bacterium]